MATLTTGYSFAAGETNITHTKLNNAVNNATISGILAADLSAGLVTAVKLNADSAGLGMAQNSVSKALDQESYGFTATVLTNVNVTLTWGTSAKTQKFTGSLSGPVVINASRSGAEAGDRIRIILNCVVSATNTLTIQENASGSLEVWNSASLPNVKGWIDLDFNGTSWEVSASRVQES